MGPLSISLKGVDTSYPTLNVGKVLSSLDGYEVKESQNKPGMFMIKLNMITEEPYNDTKGKLQPPGFKFSANLTLPGAPGAEAEHEEMRIKGLASFLDAALGTNIDDRPDMSAEVMEQCVKKKMMVKFKKSKDDTFGETQVSGFEFVPTM